MIKLHKEVLLTCNIFFMKNTILTDVESEDILHRSHHLENCTVPQIFKSFKEVYQYYLHRGFRITTVHTYSKLGNLKSLIESLTGVPLVNMATEN